MIAAKRQTIRLEKIERLVLPNVFQRFCPICQFERFFVSTEQATVLTGLTTRQIFRLVELDAIHFFETEEGFLFICEDSLKNSSLNHTVFETNKRQTQVIQITK